MTSITNQTIDGIVYELSQGMMADAVSHWQVLGKAFGRCTSICDGFVELSTGKCAECLVGNLISESSAKHLSEQESQRYIEHARELNVWIDLRGDS